ncbi:hypothetical protein C798_25355 [Herbaspirillum rubrisubalbicans Os34]|uniref:Uncharacterized protein n=1 Tax=Herbaspirillum rubrisubalbicans Os34 TaxID=1235827 RepID=A0A6M4A184_9BURK|nr:hypothetical protein C798_25355 [Herbaspirillum rubrisubalbicans Os34]
MSVLNLSGALELIEAFSVLSDVHPGELVYVCIRRDLAFHPGCRLNGPYSVDLHVGSSYRLAKNYVGLSLGEANEVALRYLLKHGDGIAPMLH